MKEKIIKKISEVLPSYELKGHHKKKIEFLLVVFPFETLDDAITIAEQSFFDKHIDDGTNDIVGEFLLYVERISRNTTKSIKEQKINHILRRGKKRIPDWHNADAEKLLLEYVAELIISDLNEEEIVKKLDLILLLTKIYTAWAEWHEKIMRFVDHTSSDAA